MNDSNPDEFQHGDILTHANERRFIKLFLNPFEFGPKRLNKKADKDNVLVHGKRMYVYLGHNNRGERWSSLDTAKVLTSDHGVRWIFKDELKKL